MKVSKSWLQELVDLKTSITEVEHLLPLRTIATKEINDQFIELDMKGYNRADLLSMRGVAYEIAAISDSDVRFQEPSEDSYIWVNKNLPQVPVEVEDSDLCPLYCLAKIEGLTIQPSPKEWVQKLSESGMRSINNIVDVTNLIMLEYGQPLHAFNGAEIAEGKIIVRKAKEGEELITLDDKKRSLKSTDLVIADPEKAVGLAGVMGGKNSEITDNASEVYLEAAIFNPIALRKTANRLGLHSEASKRFQHGLTKKRLLQALQAAVEMLGGELTAITIVDNARETVKIIDLNLDKVNSLIGIELSPEEIENYLTKLRFQIEKTDQQNWKVTVPYFRLDIELQEDLIEEIARLYGYERIPAKELEGELPERIDQTKYQRLFEIKEILVNLGLTEVQSYSYSSQQVVTNLEYKDGELLKLLNPISAETEYMRQNIWPNLLEFVDKNLRQGFKDIAMFEIGKVYYPQKEGMPLEQYRLSIALVNEKDNPAQELNSIVQKMFEKLGIATETDSQDLPAKVKDFFHPNRHLEYTVKDLPIGSVVEVHPKLLYKFGIDKKVAIAEFDLTSLI